jgi:hypothetical protein
VKRPAVARHAHLGILPKQRSLRGPGSETGRDGRCRPVLGLERCVNGATSR